MSDIKFNSLYLGSKCTGLTPINSEDIGRQQIGYYIIHKMNIPSLVISCHRRK